MVGLEIQLGQLESLNERHSYKPKFNGPLSNKANTSSWLRNFLRQLQRLYSTLSSFRLKPIGNAGKQRYPVLFSRWQRAKPMGNNNTMVVEATLSRQLFDSVERL